MLCVIGQGTIGSEFGVPGRVTTDTAAHAVNRWSESRVASCVWASRIFVAGTSEQVMEHSDVTSILELDVEEVSPTDVDLDRLAEAISSDDNRVRTHAAQLSFSLASQDLETGVELTPTLLSAVDPDEQAVVLKGVFGTLALVAEERPEELEDDVGPLVDGLAHDLPLVRMLAARAVGPVAAEYPEQFAPYTATLLDVLDRNVETPIEQIEQDREQVGLMQSIGTKIERRELVVEGVVANLIAAIADVDSAALVSDANRLVGFIDDSTIETRAPLVAAVAALAEDRPALVSDAIDPIGDLLDADNESVVVHAVTALGFIGDDSATDLLRTVAEDPGRNDEVRSLAEDTAEWLENQGS